MTSHLRFSQLQTMDNRIAHVPRTEQEAAASYTRLSKWYDRFGSSEEPHVAEGLRLLNVQPGERVLEVGFGTGRSLIALAHAVGSTGQVIGIDFSPGMIAVAREQVRKSCPSVVIGHPDDPTASHANSDNGFPPTARGNDDASCGQHKHKPCPVMVTSCPSAFIGHPDSPPARPLDSRQQRAGMTTHHAGSTNTNRANCDYVMPECFYRASRLTDGKAAGFPPTTRGNDDASCGQHEHKPR
jgi:hypothetical protein